METPSLTSDEHSSRDERLRTNNQTPSDAGHGLRWALVPVLMLGSVVTGIGLDRFLLGPGGAASGEFVRAEGFEILDETYTVIRDSYVLEEEVSDEDLIHGAAMGMVQSLGDTNHSRFYDPEEARRFMEQSRGELTGIGVNIDASSLPLRITMPLQGSPAHEAGVEAGDLIIGIDGTSVSDLDDPAEALAMIRGDEGTSLTLLLQRPGVLEPFEVTVTRSTIEIHPVSWVLLPGDVLWVRIDQFSLGAGEDFDAALQSGISLGAKGLLLDMRANPGGLVTEAIAVGEQLLPEGSVLFQRENTEGQIEQVVTESGERAWQARPVVVLIDGSSASAAEIVASALEDNGRALLMGETTAGTGTVLTPTHLSDGSMVLVGTELWLTPNGEVIWHQGVDPTIEIENSEGATVALPFTFGTHEVGENELALVDDDQLIGAHAELLGTPVTIGDPATPVPQASPQPEAVGTAGE